MILSLSCGPGSQILNLQIVDIIIRKIVLLCVDNNMNDVRICFILTSNV